MGEATINRKILLGVTGGVAAYKAAELVREFKKQGDDVQVVMTEAARQFITPLTFQSLSGHPVHYELNDAAQEQSMGHIHLSRWADFLLIAPATANILGKLAHGVADDLLSTLYLAAECPVILAPAMNPAMWRKPVTQRNIALLQADGARIVYPEEGDTACGDQGQGRMADIAVIRAALPEMRQPHALNNRHILITAGPTREPLDPVRFISNRSSGKMGFALAEAALRAGAKVTLISGPVNLSASPQINLIAVETARQMYDAVFAHVSGMDICIAAAAVADYRPIQPESRKIKKQHDISSIELQKNPDIIADIGKLPRKPFTVGFAAETDDLSAYAQHKLESKNLDMIAANWVGKEEGGFDSDQNALEVFWPGGRQSLAMTGKPQLAAQLLQLVGERYQARCGASLNPD